MINGRKNSSKYIILAILLIALTLLTSDIYSNYTSEPRFCNSLTAQQDTTIKPIVKNDTIPGNKDSIVNTQDTIKLKISKDSLDAPVIYEAADSMAFDVPNKRIILYSKGHIIYKDMDLKADSIAMDQNTNMLVATYRKDSSGKIIGLPEMLQGETKMSADIIKFNFKNQRGFLFIALLKKLYLLMDFEGHELQRAKFDPSPGY